MSLLNILTSPLPTLNFTLIPYLTPTTLSPPIYHTAQPSLLPWITDKHLSLLSPLLVYWGLSSLFHLLDTLQLPYFESKRIHESPEVLSRNKASIQTVIKAVVVQQVVQTILGWLWLESEEVILQREVYLDHLAEMKGIAGAVGKVVMLVLGPTGESVIRSQGQRIVQWVYWWGIPIAQMLFAFFVIDTWQYFLHRLFHTVPFLYRHFHSVHHRLYVPYAFGALYNHPIEGLLLDTLGAAVAHSLSLMTVRQAVVLFTVSTWKTVGDHCGYRLWWDPMQWGANEVDYHDMHHQSWGIKKNFSQPFFTQWDILLGTRMTRAEASRRFSSIGLKSLPPSSSVLSALSSSTPINSSTSAPHLIPSLLITPPSLRSNSTRSEEEAEDSGMGSEEGEGSAASSPSEMSDGLETSPMAVAGEKLGREKEIGGLRERKVVVIVEGEERK